jgi:hypothetical protein
VEVAAEGDQAVLSDRPQVTFRHQIRSRRQRLESRVVTSCPFPDDLLVSPVGPGSPYRHPGGEDGVHFLDAGEGPAGETVVADDQHPAFDAALALGPVGGRHIDIEVVVAGQSDRLRMQRNRFTRSHVTADDRLGPVVMRAAVIHERLATRGGDRRLLRRHGWSWRQPARRAIERDDDAVELWKQEVWPRVRAPRSSACADVARAASPWGDRVSMAGMTCYKPGERSRLIYAIREYRGRKVEPKAFGCAAPACPSLRWQPEPSRPGR